MTSGSGIIWRTIRLLNYARCIPCNNVTSFSSPVKEKLLNSPTVSFSRLINTTNNCLSENNVIDEPSAAKKKKLFIPKITLLSDKDDISVMTLEEAQKLAKRRSLKLVKIVDFDTKTERPVYKLMNINDFIQEETKAKAEAKEAKETALKEDKTITVSSKISEHDLNTKIKSIHKMLGKRHGVRAVISIDSGKEKADEVRSMIIEKCQDVAKVVTKSDSAHNLKVTIRPVIEKIKKNENTDEEKIGNP